MELKDIARRLLPVLMVSCGIAVAWLVLSTWPSKPRPPAAVRTAAAVSGPTIETAIGATVDQANAVRGAIHDARQVLAEGIHHDLAAARDAIVEAVRAEGTLTRQVIAARTLPLEIGQPSTVAAPPPTSPPTAETQPPAQPEPRPVIQRPRPKPTKMLAAPKTSPAPEPTPAAIEQPAWQPRFPRPEPARERSWLDDVANR